MEKPYAIQFKFDGGGAGDFVAWTPAIQYSIEANPHIRGQITAPDMFYPLAKLWFKQYEPRFKIRNVEDPHIPMVVPSKAQPNALGYKLMDIGFMYYCNTDINSVDPKYRIYPIIVGDERDLGRFKLPEKYVVITTGATAANRAMSSDAINAVSRWVKDKGVTPVYLGKKFLAGGYSTKFKGDIDYSLGMDLREKTELVEAACILARAQAVVGVDNGLLHVAACSNVPLIYGFTNIAPWQRVPPRRGGITRVIEPPVSLGCRFCGLRRFNNESTNTCHVGTFECIDSLTGEMFINALQEFI